jgi:hypothetical protein
MGNRTQIYIGGIFYMSEIEEYKRGYRDGFKDGFNQSKGGIEKNNIPKTPNTNTLPPQTPVTVANSPVDSPSENTKILQQYSKIKILQEDNIPGMDINTWPYRPTIPVSPSPPYPPYTEPETVCPKCGMVWKGVMMYSCADMQCPIQPKVTC